jgi:hypothetical protein
VFLCEKENSTSELRQAMTKQLDKWLIEPTVLMIFGIVPSQSFFNATTFI